MKPRVYIETTIPSYLTARPNRDPVILANQERTRDWWSRREAFELFVSELVIEECEEGDPGAAADRLAALDGIPILIESPEVGELADLLIRTAALPSKAAADAAHIATAAVHGMHYLLTWNCTHIANAVLRPRIGAACQSLGYAPPIICTPAELRPVGDGS